MERKFPWTQEYTVFSMISHVNHTKKNKMISAKKREFYEPAKLVDLKTQTLELVVFPEIILTDIVNYT